MKIIRLRDEPIIDRSMDERLGNNINGPCLIRVPDWIENPLGTYYLYFAHHQGQFIRMAYSDYINGPYTVHTEGVLDIDDTPMKNHIASPEVHVDDDAQKITMHYHGCAGTSDSFSQKTAYAESKKGLHFTSDTTYLARPYLRTIFLDGWYYGFTGGPHRYLSRNRDLREPFEEGPVLHVEGEDFTDFSTYDGNDPKRDPIYRMRHTCFHRRGKLLDIYYSAIGDRPERIKRTTVDLEKDWEKWQGSAPQEVIQPETSWEGVNEPLVRSEGGSMHEPVHELRDPYIYEEDEHVYLFYSTAGEQGIGVAEIQDAENCPGISLR